MGLKHIVFEDLDWIHRVPDRIQWQDLVKMIINFPLP
jgi:hypothetical protein